MSCTPALQVKEEQQCTTISRPENPQRLRGIQESSCRCSLGEYPREIANSLWDTTKRANVQEIVDSLCILGTDVAGRSLLLEASCVTFANVPGWVAIAQGSGVFIAKRTSTLYQL